MERSAAVHPDRESGSVVDAPVNPLFQISAERVQQDGFGQLLIGGGVLYVASDHLDMIWSFGDVLDADVLVFRADCSIAAINLFFASFSFWMVDSFTDRSAVFSLSDFAVTR